MTRFVALLRGINVGGNRRLAMGDLREVVATAGGTDVRTYIQSGNVVLSHRARSGGRVAAEIEERIAEATGMEVSVVVRTAAEWTQIVSANPFPAAGPTQLHVVFMKEPVSPSAAEGLDLDALAPEELVVSGRELYLHLPDGMGRAKLPVALERSRLGGTGTSRNWRTVLALDEMLRDGD